jgi:hypothetical protein
VETMAVVTDRRVNKVDAFILNLMVGWVMKIN